MLDLQHPHSAQVLRAARHLDVLQALSQRVASNNLSDIASAAASELAALAQLSIAEFPSTQASVQLQLQRIATCFGLPLPAPAPHPEARLAAALAQLEQDFDTWLI